MTDQQTLGKAIQKVCNAGLDNTLTRVFRHAAELDELDFLLERMLDKNDVWYYKTWIFNHDFAKALWGEEWKSAEILEKLPKENTYKIGTITPCWQWHLQNMVIAEDPIKYLGENI